MLTLEFQRATLRLACDNTKFAANYATLLKEEYFETQTLRQIYKLILSYTITYERELDQSSLLSLTDQYCSQRSFSPEVFKMMKEEVETIFRTPVNSEQFITDQIVTFCRRQELKIALIKSIEVLEKDLPYDQIPKLIDKAISIGHGGRDGMNYDDLKDLPTAYREAYKPEKLTPTGFQKFDDTMMGGMAPGELHVILSPPKMGKCLAKGTRVMMYTGETQPVETIKVGDLLMGPDSRPRRVLGLGYGWDTMYKIHQNKADPYTVNSDHILSLKNTSTKEVVNISVKDYLTQTNWFKDRHKGYKSSVDFPESLLPLDPYFLGLWLGDGDKSSPRIYTPDQEVIDFLEQYAVELGLSLHTQKDPRENCWLVEINSGEHNNNRDSQGRYSPGQNPVTATLREIGVLNNKHIPKQFLYNSRQSRLKLLAGLIDSDGNSDGKNGIEFSSVNPELARGFVWLARSLGFRATLAKRESSCQTGAVGQYYVVVIYGDIAQIPCKIPRKLKSIYHGKHKRDPLVTGIRVEEVGWGEYFGFELDGDGLFLLEDFTVTHNTTLGVNFGAYSLISGKAVFHITLEIKEIDLMAKYAARMSGLTYEELQSLPLEEYQNRIAKFDQFKPKLFVNYWTQKTINALTIRSWICRIRSQTGISPGLLIVDYDDLLLPVSGSKDDMYLDAGEIYSDLIGLADYFNAPCVTFAQPQREAWDKAKRGELIHSYELAHSAKKAHHCFSISSLNFPEGSDRGVLYMDLVRRGESGVKIPIFRDLSRSLIRERDASEMDPPKKDASKEDGPAPAQPKGKYSYNNNTRRKS